MVPLCHYMSAFQVSDTNDRSDAILDTGEIARSISNSRQSDDIKKDMSSNADTTPQKHSLDSFILSNKSDDSTPPKTEKSCLVGLQDVFAILISKTEDEKISRSGLLAGLPHLHDCDDVFAYLNECVADAVVVRKELVLVQGNEVLISRVFVRLKGCACSYDIGWIVGRDVPNCMVCSAAFGFFRTRRHCYACGGVFCGACTSSQACIESCFDVGAVPICKLCYFGQV